MVSQSQVLPASWAGALALRQEVLAFKTRLKVAFILWLHQEARKFSDSIMLWSIQPQKTMSSTKTKFQSIRNLPSTETLRTTHLEDWLKCAPPTNGTTWVFLPLIMLIGRRVCSLEECPMVRIIKKSYSSPKIKNLTCIMLWMIASRISRFTRASLTAKLEIYWCS